jgi:Leucine-rich repeat (LRR) protein
MWARTTLLILASLIGLTACSDFDVKVNERRVFNTEPLFEGYDIPDEALRSCVSDAIASGRISAAAQLQELNCRGLGISDLAGIGTFTGLERLRLSENSIRNLTPLTPLSSLQELYLDRNQIVDPVPLFDLLSLRILDISRNGDLKCPSSVSLLRAQEIQLPRHCR